MDTERKKSYRNWAPLIAVGSLLIGAGIGVTSAPLAFNNGRQQGRQEVIEQIDRFEDELYLKSRNLYLTETQRANNYADLGNSLNQLIEMLNGDERAKEIIFEMADTVPYQSEENRNDN
jgi:hypothetical protein